MTSQGVGEPFAPGEKIMGYQACGLKGSCYLDVDEIYGEKLMNISPGDEAVFRYVKNGDCWKGIEMIGSGNGSIEVYFNDVYAGTVTVEEGKGESDSLFAEAGEHELVLKFKEAVGLEIGEITLR